MAINVRLSNTPQLGVRIANQSEQKVSSATIFLGGSNALAEANLALETANLAFYEANSALTTITYTSQEANSAYLTANFAFDQANTAIYEINQIANGGLVISTIDAGIY